MSELQGFPARPGTEIASEITLISVVHNEASKMADTVDEVW